MRVFPLPWPAGFSPAATTDGILSTRATRLRVWSAIKPCRRLYQRPLTHQLASVWRSQILRPLSLSMISPLARVTDMSGRQGIAPGPTIRAITTGSPAHGYLLQKSTYSGPRVIGAGVVIPSFGMRVTGARKLASTAGSITVLAISASDLSEDAGIMTVSSTIAP